MDAISVDIDASRLLQDAYNLLEAPEMDSSDLSELEDAPETEAPEQHLPHLLPRHSPQLLLPELTPLLYTARPPPPPPLFHLISPPTPHNTSAAPPHLLLAFPSPEAANPSSGPPDVSSEVQGSRTPTGRRHFVSGKRGMESGSERDERPSAEMRQGGRNRRRTKRRRKLVAERGHDSTDAIERKVRPARPISTELQGDSLPIASGAWVGIDCDFYGAKKAQTVKELIARGMRLIAYEKGYVRAAFLSTCRFS